MSAQPIFAAFRQALAEAWAGGAGALLPLGFFAGTAVLVPLALVTLWMGIWPATAMNLYAYFTTNLESLLKAATVGLGS